IEKPVTEKPIDEKIEMKVFTEFQEYDPTLKCSCWVDLNLKAPEFEEDDSKRAAVDIVAVIDRSGSMSGSKLALVKKTLHFVVSQLTAKDRLCLVVYDDSVDIVFPLTNITVENKGKLETKIDDVKTRGSTNLCGGLIKGMVTVMDRISNKADVASVLLLTDGLANVGISAPAGIL
ncbi:vWA domain-containing protein, partial [Salmonella sp. s54836]|uniref:vWA domain-containing protein n=1 Tax=Salmonella sp. s54836 TaxID=3159673 RepID=UPI00397FD942